MKTRYPYLWFFLTVIYFPACGTRAENPLTEKFERYLKQFGLEIPEEEHFFLVLTREGCKGCSRQILKDYPRVIGKPDITTIIVYNGVPGNIPEKFKEVLDLNPDALIDSGGDIFNYPFSIESDGIIITANKQYHESVLFQRENFDDLYARLGINLKNGF